MPIEVLVDKLARSKAEAEALVTELLDLQQTTLAAVTQVLVLQYLTSGTKISDFTEGDSCRCYAGTYKIFFVFAKLVTLD